jgi:hypothetical protein
VQHDWVGVGAIGDVEWNAVLHQTGNVVHVAGQPVELGDDDRRPLLAGDLKGSS